MSTDISRIALIGYRGSGKTSVGKALARMLSWEFIDTDALITSREGRDVTAIFREHGEAYFRDRESAALVQALATANAVIATGGGIIEREENRERLRELSYVVYLSAPIEALIARIEAGVDRPALTALPMKDEIRTVLARRIPLYERTAHGTLDTGEGSIDDAAASVMRMMRET